MTKIFFFDIDGTLALHGKIMEGNLEMLKSLKEKGYKTYICTGRAVYYAKNMFKDYVTGYIACNGRYIEENGQLLHGEELSEEEMNYYVSEFERLKIGYFFAASEKAYYAHFDQKGYEGLVKQYTEARLVAYTGQKEKFYTFDLSFDKDRFTELQEVFKDHLVLNNHYNGSCDCTTICFDKGSAIKYLLDYYHISKEDSYAFGDGANDVYMFREAGNKIAMGNALPSLKEKATYITDDFDKQGIQKALEYYKI